MDLAGLAEEVLQPPEEVGVEPEEDEQEDETDDGEVADAVADGAEIFDELLLLQGVAVGGFADAFEVIFDALEGAGLLLNLSLELSLGGLQVGETSLDGFEVYVNLRGRNRMLGLLVDGHHECADRIGEVALEKREQLLDVGKRGADRLDDLLQSGFGGVGVFRRGGRGRRR